MDALREELSGVLSDRPGKGAHTVLLVPSYADTVLWKRYLAHEGRGFGVTVTTLAQWLVELWELFGDERRAVDGAERLVLCRKALEDVGFTHPSPGLLSLLKRLVIEALPLFSEGSLPQGLAPSERCLAQAALRYKAALLQRRLIELSQMVAFLVDDKVARFSAGEWCVHYAGFKPDDLPVVQAKLLLECGAKPVSDALVEAIDVALPDEETTRSLELDQLVERLYRPHPSTPIRPTGALRLAFASGPSVERQLMISGISDLITQDGFSSVMLACLDPLTVFRAVSCDLAATGCAVSLESPVPFSRTRHGRFLIQLAELIHGKEGDFNHFAATDFALNPVSGIDRSVAFRRDNFWRSDRLIDVDAILSDLAGNEPYALQGVIPLAEENDFLSVINLLIAQMNRRPARYGVEVELEYAALSLASSMAELIADESMNFVTAVGLLADEMVRAPCALKPDEIKEPAHYPLVRVMTLEDVAACTPSSVDALFVTSLNAAERRPGKSDGPLQTLLAKVHGASHPDMLGRFHRMYRKALASARSCVVLERSLTAGDDGATLYPATLFEETIDCYRFRLTDSDEIDPVLAIPRVLEPFVTYRSETGFLFALTGSEKRPVALAVPLIPSGNLSPQNTSAVVVSQTSSGQGFDSMSDSEKVFLSPSVIESYLECPYLWFVRRRLRLSTPDEGFGSLEQGSFIHSVLRHFYEEFLGRGFKRVLAENVSEAIVLLEQVFDTVAQSQPGKHRGKGRYVPLTRLEEEYLESLKPKLCDYIVGEQHFLPGFYPRYFEWEFDTSLRCHYGGYLLKGGVDRIDVDDRGRAVIIDYKSSLTDVYDLHGAKAESFQLPRKMQALIYAKAVQEVLGYEVVATLYLSPLRKIIRGAYDANVFNPEELRDIRVSTSRVPFGDVPSFFELIARSEKAVSLRLNELAQGVIEPRPYDERVCKCCPALLCDRRLS